MLALSTSPSNRFGLRRCRSLLVTATIGGCLNALPVGFGATGIPAIDQNKNLSVAVDARLRYESDWDSHTSSGSLRTDRKRGRLRARVGIGYKLSDQWSMGARVRTGSRQSQQSPHITFTADDGPNDDFEVSFDRYYFQYKDGPLTFWGGRNSTPFWQQNEMFWDEDVTPTGIAAIFDAKHGTGTLTTTVGAFALPDGAVRLNGNLLAGQLKYTAPINASNFTIATGLHSFHGEGGARYLRNRNGARDYLVGIVSAQWSTPIGGFPVALGVDLIENFQSYSAADAAPLLPSNTGETSGYVLSAQLGQLKDAKHWLLGYYYAHIETFAVNAAYAQDDWARFGSATQSDLTDIEGHEFRAAYAITKNINVMARLFLVDAITTRQDAKRFRLDLNWKL
jgi:hypothetical protein